MLEIKKFILYVYFTLFFVTFSEQITRFNFADEIFLFLSIVIILVIIVHQATHLRIGKIFLVLILYLLYQVVNVKVSPFSYDIFYTFAQSFINIKVFLVTLSVLLVFENTKSNSRLVYGLLCFFITLFVFGMLANLLLQEYWNTLVNYPIRYRYGFLRPAGWFVSPAQNALFFTVTLTTILLINCKNIIIKNSDILKNFYYLIVLETITVLLFTVRKGMIVAIPFGFVVLAGASRGNKRAMVIFGSVFLGGSLFLLKDTQIFQDTIMNAESLMHGDHAYTRGLMIYHGFLLFLEFLPFGTGAATFGTVLSKYNTLEVYSYVGMPKYTYTGDDLIGLYDSGIFSTIAENGLLGISILVIFIYYFFKFNKRRLDPYNYKIFKIITWFTILISLTEPVWQNGMFTVFFVINILYIYTKNNFRKCNGDWIFTKEEG